MSLSLETGRARLFTTFHIGIGSRLIGTMDRVLDWQDRMRQRHHLGTLDDRMLSDIGILRSEAEAEIRKPFWRI